MVRATSTVLLFLQSIIDTNAEVLHISNQCGECLVIYLLLFQICEMAFHLANNANERNVVITSTCIYIYKSL